MTDDAPAVITVESVLRPVSVASNADDLGRTLEDLDESEEMILDESDELVEVLEEFASDSETGTLMTDEHLGHFTRLPRNAMLTRIVAPQPHVARIFSVACKSEPLRTIVFVVVSDSSSTADSAGGGTRLAEETGRFRT